MINHTDFYIIGNPITTDIGEAHFIRVKDYPDYMMDLQTIGMSKLEIIHKYREIYKDGSADELIEEMQQLTLFGITLGLPELHQSYHRVFVKVFGNEDVLEKINEDNFDFYRRLVMDMHCIKEEEINPNPEIQRAIERSRRVKAQEQEKLTFADICSSIVVENKITYEELLEYTIFQMYMTFHRINVFKNHDVTSLFATVTSEVKVESWSKHIDLFEKEKHFVTEDQFKKNTGSMFSD